VIEDLHTAYWPEFGGQKEPGSPTASVGLLRDPLDELHRCEFAHDHDGLPTGHHPSDISVYHNLAVLRQEISHERDIPAWIQQRAEQWINPGGVNQ
jgi:hypothetical protein